MADYEHDIFISYRRMSEEWVNWTRKNFVRPLRALLQPSLGSDISIFVDEQIETGNSYPARLAQAHARSRLMIPVLSPDYFNSDWCRIELVVMHNREKSLGFRTSANPFGLILPVIINDGDKFPTEVQEMQGKKIYDFAQPCMCPDSHLQERFAECLRAWCPCIEHALEKVPPYNPDWELITFTQFRETFRIAIAKQKTLPSLSLHPVPPLATNP